MSGFKDNGKINISEKQTSWSKVLEFSLKAVPGHDQGAIDKIAAFLNNYQLRPNCLSNLKEAVRVAASKMIEDASLINSEQMIHFQVLVSAAMVELNPQPAVKNTQANQVGWGFFLVQILDGSKSGIDAGESSYLLRLYVYVEGDQLEH